MSDTVRRALALGVALIGALITALICAEPIDGMTFNMFVVQIASLTAFLWGLCAFLD